MKTLRLLALAAAILLSPVSGFRSPVSAQVTNLSINSSTHRVVQPVVKLPNGATLTIESGATLDVSAATLTLPSTIVLTTGAQTLASKTLSAPTVTGTLTSAGLASTYSNGGSYSLFGHIIASHDAQNVLIVTNLDGNSTSNNYYSAAAFTDPNQQSQVTFGYGNDTDAALPWRRNGYIEMWIGPAGTQPLPGFVVVQTTAANSFFRQQILSTTGAPGDQIFYTGQSATLSAAEQLRLKTNGDITTGGATDNGARLTIGGSVGGTNSTLILDGATAAPAYKNKPGLYHRTSVGLGIFADAGVTIEVNGSSGTFTEALRIVNNAKVGIATGGANPVTDFQIGNIGAVKEMTLGLNDSFAHFREIDATNAVGITTNLNSGNTADDLSIPSWKLRLGSAALDNFIIARAPAGSATMTELLKVTTTAVTISPSAVLTPGAASGSPVEGMLYYDSATHHFLGWTGSAWKQLDN